MGEELQPAEAHPSSIEGLKNLFKPFLTEGSQGWGVLRVTRDVTLGPSRQSVPQELELDA